MKKFEIICFGLWFFVSACTDDFLEVVPNNGRTTDEVFRDISRSQQFLNPAYQGVRNAPWISLENHTDNAVHFNGPARAAVSGPTAEFSAIQQEWNNAIRLILHINEFFDKGFDVIYDAFDDELAIALKRRIRGEAFGLRAYYKWLLLKNFAGPSAENPAVMLGIPIIDRVLTAEDANNIVRSNYLESYNNILQDLDSAYTYVDILRYAGDGDVDGVRFTSRVSQEMILALKARMALFAASPAYAQIPMEEAAATIYESINQIDGGAVASLQPFGNFNDPDNPDHLWRRAFSENASLESAHFPPSLFGRGECNPSQNLVNAFPDIHGYPITDPGSLYDPENPYESRDLRFERFIFYNGQNDFNNVFIETFTGGKDAHGGFRKRATRSGYYLKKFLSANVNFDTDVQASREDFKVYPIFNREGLYLDFAEAAVEAYGTAGQGPGMAFSARDVLAAIRLRAGIEQDDYLAIAVNDLDKYRQLIRNERRIEFAFEGERYYDLRRWKLPLEALKQPVMGVLITQKPDQAFDYQYQEIESRNFEEYMYYNPVPRVEILRSNALIQNFGWE